jgi:plastocyanin
MKLKLVLLTVLAAALAAPAAFAITPTLKGTVGPGFTITLKKGTTKVLKVKHGLYVIKISDQSSSHNFHLTGPGVNKSTTVAFQGTVKWTLRLKVGTYKYQCDPHASFMHGSFKVT